MPRIKNFTDHVDHVDKKIVEMSAIIKKFDENLSMKANKNLLIHTMKEF